MTVVWTKSAKLDRLDILGYIARDDPDAAARFNERISEAVDVLARFPNSGRPGRVSGTRELVVHANYVVVYKLLEDAIAIVNILHAARQYP